MGFGVAEAMDTAQRGAGLREDEIWPLIHRTAAEASASGGRVVFGITTDDLGEGAHEVTDVIASYEHQLELLEAVGGTPVLMPSRALVGAARSEEDYVATYERLINGSRGPMMLHWLGEMFDPALGGYWGHLDPWKAADVLLEIIEIDPEKIFGIKVSVLDLDLEIDFRRRLPPGVRCYTGDDFDFPTLIAGDGGYHSDALLGILDVIAPVASRALHRLDQGDRKGFLDLMAPTVPLSRLLFSEPTWGYKTGLVFLAYLTGHQEHFRMLAGMEGARSVVHLSELLRLADQAGLITDPETAGERMTSLLNEAGIR
jgi:hypothetical protein